MGMMATQREDFPDLSALKPPNPNGFTIPTNMNWREKFPQEDPNPAPAEGGVLSPTMEEREEARPNLDTGQRRNPWLHDGNLKVKPQILKSDLLLPNVQGHVEGDTLCLDPTDYVPISESWGFCLLGFMAGKFPGRDAIERMIKSWSWPARVAFHPNGWMVFRFETMEDMENARLEGNLSVFGTPLMLCSMPEDFNFEEAPDFKFKVWASLPELQLELWQPSTLAKIASMVGTPIEVDHRTVARINIDGPRIHVIVDAKNPPPDLIKVKLPNGKVILQKIKFDFYPLYCLNCRRMGHSTSICRVASKTNPGPSFGTRGNLHAEIENDGWQLVKGRKNKQRNMEETNGFRRARSSSRSNSRPLHAYAHASTRDRSKSRPHSSQARVDVVIGPSAVARGAIPKDIPNVHTYITSPPPNVDLLRSNATPNIEEPQKTPQHAIPQPPVDCHAHAPHQGIVAPVGDDGSEGIYEDLTETTSHMSESHLEDQAARDLSKPNTVKDMHKLKDNEANAREQPHHTTTMENSSSSQSLLSSSSLPDWIPELEKNPPQKAQSNINKKRGGSPKKVRGGAVARKSNRGR